MTMKIMLFGSIIAFVLTASHVNAADGQGTYALRGTVGPYPIGAELMLKDDHTLSSGHYFYDDHLTDISLNGSIGADSVVLHGSDGSTFRLHFVSNDSAAGQPLTFFNSTGLRGEWVGNGKTLPVKLDVDWSTNGPPPQRQYADVTDATDATFEAHARLFIQSVLDDKKTAAAALVSYPLRVLGAAPMTIRSDQELIKAWDSIFTPALLAQLKNAIPHDMFVRDGKAMVSNGLVWFGENGVSEINRP